MVTERPSEMAFSPSLSSTKVTGNSFDFGDSFGVYVVERGLPLQASGNYATNSSVRKGSGGWTVTPKIYWGEGEYDIYAYYPFVSPAPASVDEYRIEVSTDQTGGYGQSDFLWAKTSPVSRAASIPVVFRHRMSRVDVNLIKGEDFEGDIPGDALVYIHNTVTSALADLSTGDVVKDPFSSVNTITACKKSTGSYSAIIVPQRIENRRPLVEIVVGKVSYLFESTFVFKQGMCHTVNITLSDDPEKVLINIGGEIETWE